MSCKVLFKWWFKKKMNVILFQTIKTVTYFKIIENKWLWNVLYEIEIWKRQEFKNKILIISTHFFVMCYWKI